MVAYTTAVKPMDEAHEIVPNPAGYRILIALPDVNDKTEGGVELPDEYLRREQTATIVGLAYKVGDLCYKDEKKFPTGPWCKEGDWVLFRSYSGTRFKINGQEYRLINDDSVEAVVPDPRAISRAF
jgi:co-chaperonin GroES (HSP10)